MSNTYTIAIENETPTIFNEDGSPVSNKTALLIIASLGRSYSAKCWVYIGQNPITRLWKIGISRNVPRRAEQLGIIVEHVIQCSSPDEARQLEILIHEYCKDQHIKGEWFDLPPDTLNFLQTMVNYESVHLAWLRISTFVDGKRNLSPEQVVREGRGVIEWIQQLIEAVENE